MRLKMNFSILTLRLALGGMFVLVAACEKIPVPAEPARPVLTILVGERGGSEEPSYSGEVRSRYETPLGFRIPGKIVARLVDVGDLVKPGQVLAQLDPADTALSVAAARAQQTLAEAEASRYRELRRQNFVSQAALDGKEATLVAARSQGDLARNQAAYTALKSEQAGVVVQVSAELGQVVSAGQTVFRVARPDTLEVAVSIPESRLEQLRASKEAEISLWADDHARYQGTVRELSPIADPITRTYAARVAIARPDARILLGMTAKVRFLHPGSAQRLTVPLTAIFQQEGKPAVWRVNADQTVVLRPVEVASYGDLSAVLAAGVEPGERIVVAGVHKLAAGEKIRLAKQAVAQ